MISQTDIVSIFLKPFLVGSVSGCVAASVVLPIDTIKVIIQARRQSAERGHANLSPFSIGSQIVKINGLKGLYKGLDSALLRQFVYTGLRFGLFRAAELDIKKKQRRMMSLSEKTVYSMGAGLIGAGLANPLDMALIRLQADTTLPPSERRNYKSVFDALNKMYKELNFFGMWRGSVPTIARAMVTTSCVLVPYNEAKEQLLIYTGQSKQTTSIRLLASAISGISVCVGSLPFDNIKTKMLKMKANSAGEYPYKNMVDCFMKSVVKEGVRSLWVGMTTFYFKVAPNAMISILVQDYLHDALKDKTSQC